MRLLLLDTETDGLDPSKNKCIEVACILYDVDFAAPIEMYSSLIQAKSNGAEAINNIPEGMLLVAPDHQHVWAQVNNLVQKADAFCSHRTEFDSAFIPKALSDQIPWVCSKVDIKWPKAKLGSDLVQLALAHGVGVVQAHRAFSDVDIMMRLFRRVHELGYDVDRFITQGLRPKKRFVALVSYAEKDIAKDHGFYWDPSLKQWYRSMPPEDARDLPFKVREG